MKNLFLPNASPAADAVPRRCGCRYPQAFSLVEVTLALGVMAFCMIPVFGLLPVGINSNQTALHQTRAASVAANVCADVRGTLLTLSASPRFSVGVNQTGTTTLYFSEAGDASTTQLAATSYFRADITVTPGTGQNATWLSVSVTWPASSTTTANAAGKYQSTTAVNRS